MNAGAGAPRFLDYLPETFRGDDLLARFLLPFETVYAGVLAEIEGTAQGGGIPDVFGLATTPPTELAYSGSAGYAFLSYLAGWAGLSLRPEKPLDWNRDLALSALPFVPYRGSRAGLAGLLSAWLRGDVLDPAGAQPPTLLVSDLVPLVNGATSAWQTDVASTLGVDTVLGLGPPAYVVVDLVTDQSAATDLDPEGPVRQVPQRHPVGLDVLQRAARTLLDAERPAHVGYELRIRGETLRLAPEARTDWVAGEVYGQLEDPTDVRPNGTALLWDGLTLYRSG